MSAGNPSERSIMETQSANAKIVTKLMFRLLPVQVVLAAVTAVSGLVSSYFASNFIGVAAMSAVGLYSPVNMLLTAISLMLSSGATVCIGKYLGRNQPEKMQNVFSLSLVLCVLIGCVFTVLFLLLGFFDLTGFLTRDEAVRPLLDRYFLGQAVGVLPLLLGNQLMAYLSLENQGRLTLAASLVYVFVNLALDILFVRVLRMGIFGLALASALGLWAMLGVGSWRYITGRSELRFTVKRIDWRETGSIVGIGISGALSNVYQTVRGLIVNHLILLYVGSVGVSAFAAADNLLRIFWAIPTGMAVVSRMLISVSIGEEDRRTVTDVMGVMLKRYVPLMACVSALIILCAAPLTRLFFRDPTDPVYGMTIWGLRILPLCMPLSVICMHFTTYGDAANKNGLVHTLSLLDGVVCVAGFAALLIPAAGMNSVYIANVLNGVVTTLVVIGWAWVWQKRFPRDTEDLLMLPDDFGVSLEERMDITVKTMGEVVTIAHTVQGFCRERGIDERRAFFSGLALEEMAGNVVSHGFVKDEKSHTVDVRVVRKGQDVILRLKDDCVPFDPGVRRTLTDPADPTKNIGIRMVFRLAKDVQYQSILGLNVLTIKI